MFPYRVLVVFRNPLFCCVALRRAHTAHLQTGEKLQQTQMRKKITRKPYSLSKERARTTYKYLVRVVRHSQRLFCQQEAYAGMEDNTTLRDDFATGKREDSGCVADVKLLCRFELKTKCDIRFTLRYRIYSDYSGSRKVLQHRLLKRTTKNVPKILKNRQTGYLRRCNTNHDVLMSGKAAMIPN